MQIATANEWANNWGPLLTLLTTVVLAVITGWYAYLTKSIADSARAAAKHAQTAAEAALSSVAVAEASIDVRFEVEPILRSSLGQMRELLRDLESEGMSGNSVVTRDTLARITSWQEVELTCRGAAVSVHGFTLTNVTVEEPSPADSIFTKTNGMSYEDNLAPRDTLPRLCHAGETLLFDIAGRPVDERLVEVRGAVSYSFGNGPVREREVQWTAPRDARTHTSAKNESTESAANAPDSSDQNPGGSVTSVTTR